MGIKLPSWLLRLLFARALVATTVFLVRPMISYRALALGGDAVSVGFIAAAFGLAPMLVAVPVGRLIDRGHSQRYILLSLVIATAASGALAFTQRIWELVILSAVLGLGTLVAVLVFQTLLAAKSEEGQHDQRFGLLTMATSFGQLAGPLTGGYVAQASGTLVAGGSQVPVTRWSLLVGAALTGIAAVCVVGLRGSFARSSAAASLTVRQVGRLPGVPQAVFVSLSLVACVSVITVYLPVLGQERGLSVGTVGTLLAMRAAASMLSQASASHLVDQFGRRRILLTSTLAAAAGLLLLAVPDETVIVGLLMVATGFFVGLGLPLTMTWVVRLVQPQVRGTALAMRLTGNRVGVAAVPAVAGLVAASLGVAGVFWLLGGLLGAASLTVFRSSMGP